MQFYTIFGWILRTQIQQLRNGETEGRYSVLQISPTHKVTEICFFYVEQKSIIQWVPATGFTIKIISWKQVWQWRLEQLRPRHVVGENDKWDLNNIVNGLITITFPAQDIITENLTFDFKP